MKSLRGPADEMEFEGSEPLVSALLSQYWANVRHVKDERMWFMYIYSVVVAAALSLIHSSASGETLIETSLLGFLLLLSVIGFLISLRLRVELEDWFHRIEALVAKVGIYERFDGEEVGGGITRHLKFRWVFPIFYALMSAGTFSLLVHQAVF